MGNVVPWVKANCSGAGAGNQFLGGVPSVKARVKLDPRIKYSRNTLVSFLQLSVYILMYLNVYLNVS